MYNEGLENRGKLVDEDVITGWWFGTFLFSISYMGCHPNPIDELHHFLRWLLQHQPDYFMVHIIITIDINQYFNSLLTTMVGYCTTNQQVSRFFIISSMVIRSGEHAQPKMVGWEISELIGGVVPGKPCLPEEFVPFHMLPRRQMERLQQNETMYECSIITKIILETTISFKVN